MIVAVPGSDTYRGIGYQHAQAILTALDVLGDLSLGSMRVEGVADVVDIEVFAADGSLRAAKQVKVRAEEYTWGRAELIEVLRRWAVLPDAAHASFEFVTDGRLGPTGQKLADALDCAADGDLQELAAILEEDVGSSVCAAVANARVLRDPSTFEALLSRAERQVRALLPDPRTAADAENQAEQAINRLFVEMFGYASNAEPQQRLLMRTELAQILGVPADLPVSKRWPGDLRDRYLDAARSRDLQQFVVALVAPSLPLMRDSDREINGDPLPVSSLLQEDRPSALAGRTGMGKSTAGELLRQEAAHHERVVLLAHAEAYLPGRLEALAADAISEMTREDCPAATGRQALADSDVMLVIDGVSEVPEEVREGLKTDLLAPVAASRGARIVLLGRDIAVLRDSLPSSRTPAIFQLVEFDPQRRLDLACRLLRGASADDSANAAWLPGLWADITRVDQALGDAAGNPLLLTMALMLTGQGIAFTDRAGLYRGFVEMLARRTGATGISEASAALGIAYAHLLDQGRRYADPIEWARLLGVAVAVLEDAGVRVNSRAVDATVRRCGLVVPLGWAQTRVPLHDSFADYLAGAAHANRLTPLPARLQRSDEQRVLFAAEVGGVDAAMAAMVARDLPFVIVSLAGYDRRDLTRDTPAEVECILQHLDAGSGYGICLWRVDNHRVVALQSTGKASGWVNEERAREMLPTTSAVVVDNPGPLKIAVRMWRQKLVLRLKPPETMRMPQPASQDQACVVLADHAVRAAAATRTLIAAIAPPGHDSTLAAQVGPLGLQAIVHQTQEQLGGTQYPVSYLHSDTISISKAPDYEADASLSGPEQHWGLTTVEALTRLSPEADAVSRVRAAIEEMTTRSWLAP